MLAPGYTNNGPYEPDRQSENKTNEMNDHEREHSRLAVVHCAGNPLSLVDCDIPALNEEEILIRNECTTFCRSDLNTFSDSRSEKSPIIPGHEMVGRIAAFGEADSQHDSTGRQSRNADPVHVVMEFGGVEAAMESTLALLCVGGTAVRVGTTHPERKVQLDAETIVRRLLPFKGLHNCNRQDLMAAVEFFEGHHTEFPFEGPIHHEFSLEQVDAAFNSALDSDPYRVGIRIWECQ